MALSDERKNTIILPCRHWGHPSPWPAAPVRCNPGVVLTVDDGEITASETGSVFLPPSVAGHTRPMSGWVVGVGADVPKRRGPCPPVKMEVAVGDRVLIFPYEGVRFRQLVFKKQGWAAPRVRLFGGAVGDLPVSHVDGRVVNADRLILPEFEPYHVPIPAKITMDIIEPIGDWMLIRRDPLRDKQTGLFMSEKTRGVNSLGNWKATVVAASPASIANGYSPGARIVFHAPSTMGELDFTFDSFGLEGDLEDYAFIRWTQCFFCELDEGADFFAEMVEREVACLDDHRVYSGESSTVLTNAALDESLRAAGS